MSKSRFQPTVEPVTRLSSLPRRTREATIGRFPIQLRLPLKYALAMPLERPLTPATATSRSRPRVGGGGGGGGSASSDLFVPVVLSSSGVGGSFFTTELTFTILGTSTANVDLSYTATNGGGTTTGSTTIPPGQSIFSNSIDYLISKGLLIPATGNRVGTLQAHISNLNSASDANIIARTTTAVKDSGGNV